MGNRSGLKRSQRQTDKENACATARSKSAPASRSPTKPDQSRGPASRPPTKPDSSHGPASRSPTKPDQSHGPASRPPTKPDSSHELAKAVEGDCILRPASWGPIRVPNLNGPTHLALRGDTELIISSTLGHAVHCVPLADRLDTHPHAVHPYPGQWHHFLFPTGVACDESGRCWVAECNSCTVSLCCLPKPSDGPWSTLASTGPPATGQGVLRCFGSEGAGEGQLRGPDGIALHRPSQSLLVVDQANHRVSAFDVTITPPALKFSFGQHGSGDGELSQPRGIACDDGDEVFVCDTDNNRLVVFSVAEGAFLRVLRTAVPFEQPDDCAIIGNGAIVVAEFVGRRLQLLSRSGRLLQVFDGSSLPFCQLSGVLSGDGHVFVSDFDHDLIHVFEVVGLECTRS